MPSNITTAIYLDKRFPRKDGTLPLKLRVTYQRQQKYYATGLAVSEADFQKIQGARPRGWHKEVALQLSAIEEDARDAIASLERFSFAAFERAMQADQPQPSQQRDVFASLSEYARILHEENRLRTAESYENCRKSLQAFHRRKRLAFIEVDVPFLKAYEAWMVEQGRSPSTVGVYLRSLRTIFNQAIRSGQVLQAQYPFGKGRYQIPASRNVKKALTLADVKQLIDYQPESEAEAYHLDLWLFAYLCNGMNVKDMLLLRHRNLDGPHLRFVRAKTKESTRSNQRSITVPLLPQAQAILRRRAQPASSPETFVFPVLNDDMDEARQLAVTKQLTKMINHYLRRIGEKVGIEKDITTYTARHTFSTVLKRSGASLELISESLGHSNLATTQLYLDSFEDEVKESFARKLVDFGGEG